MPATSVRNIAFDGSTTRIRISMLALPCTGIELPDEKKKIEKIAFLGEQVQTIVTPGMLELGDLTIKTTTLVWAKSLLPRLPDVFSELEFPVTVAQLHPAAPAPYHILIDRVAIIGTKQNIENSEKAGIIELPCRAVQMFHWGADRQWKSLVRRPGQPAPATQALMF
jgi:hypothetical protein